MLYIYIHTHKKETQHIPHSGNTSSFNTSRRGNSAERAAERAIGYSRYLILACPNLVHTLLVVDKKRHNSETQQTNTSLQPEHMRPT